MAANTQVNWQQARVIEVSDAATDIRRIVLAPETAAPGPPGSHIDVQVRIADQTEVRSYSVVHADAQGQQLTISVNLAPDSRGGSRFMHSLTVGDRITISQPLQNFELRIGAPRYVLLAGGVGITAIMEMAAVLQRLKADYRLVYVGRSRDRMAYVDQLAQQHGDALSLHVDDEGSALDVNALVSAIAHQGSTEMYMCGPIRLMDAVRRSWTELELPIADLRFETFGNSGWFDPEEFSVSIPRLGIETTVTANCSLLEALERAGAGVISDCRKGECGLCQVKILSVEGQVDHRDVFFSAAQHATATKMCACVSRAAASPRTESGQTESGQTESGQTESGQTESGQTRAVLTIDIP